MPKTTKPFRLKTCAIALGLAFTLQACGNSNVEEEAHVESAEEQGTLSEVRKDRKAAMENLKDALIAIKNNVTSEDFDQAVVTENANKISAIAGDPLLALFPEGTNKAPSEALDNIWTDWENFVAASAMLKTKADALAAAEGKDASLAAFGAMAQSCGGCHDKFRLKKED